MTDSRDHDAPTETDGVNAAGAAVDTREIVRSAVAARRPVDARERSSIAAFLDAYDRLDQPFSEQADKVHVTASAIVASTDDRNVVLHLHKRLKIWLQPGGHIEAGETPWDAALREAQEECGLPVSLVSSDLVHVDVHPGPRGHTHLDLRYLLASEPVAPAPAEGESKHVRWFPWRAAIARGEPGIEGLLRVLQPGRPKIRQARNNDAAECARVLMRSRAFALPSVAVVHDEREMQRWMADDVIGHNDVWVAELDGTVVGVMVLEADRRTDPRSGWIHQMYLDPAWVGRGLGDEFMALAGERLPGGLQLWSFQVNEAAQRFYARHGFAAVEHTDGRANEEREPDVRMQRAAR